MTILPNLLFRVPQFSYTSDLSVEWEALKQSISLSSEAFYSLIRDLSYEELAAQPENIRNTVWKYYNRAKYRATPYGSFAAIGTAPIKSGFLQPLTLAEKQTLHEFYNWPVHEKIVYTFQELIERDVLLWANNTWYPVDDDIRYVGHFLEGYVLVDALIVPGLLKLLEACKLPIRISSLINSLTGINAQVTLELVESLLNEQLLFCELHPNIIGEDYFDRVRFESNEKESLYIIAERPVSDGSIGPHVFRHLPDLLARLQQLLPSYYSPELEQFKTRFLKKFGEREVPLMVALDPEIGIGYGNMDEDANGNEFIRKLAFRAAAPPNEDHSSTLKLLLPFLIAGNTTPIELDDLPLPKLADNAPLPNTLPLLCTIVDDLLYVEHLGGATANSLLGRFTHVNDEILQIAESIAAIEAGANPMVDFFDVAYLVGNHVDNVNRRKAIYASQLSLLSYDTSETPLVLSDLKVCIRQNEIVLYSKSNGRRLVPKLATAYNYLLSDLPVFRFLCDLQHQGIHKNLYLRLRDRLPDLDYYPQIKFRNIILSPATWKIQGEKTGKLTPDTARAVLSEQLICRSVARYVKTGNGDQTLFFDINDHKDLTALLYLLKKEGQLYLEEAALPESSVIKDKSGSPYLPQLLLTCHHTEKIYKAYQPRAIKDDQSSGIRSFMPADEWLYLEIYCHPARTDSLLKGMVARFISHHYKKIEKWFFIRYSENGNHLRLRLKMRKQENPPELLNALNDLIRHEMVTGVVSDMVIRPYRQETERYGVKNIDLVESHFAADSNYVLQVIKEALTDEQKYIQCLDLLNEIAGAGLLEKAAYVALINTNSNLFNSEHHFGPAEFGKLNDYNKKVRTASQNYKNETYGSTYKVMVESLKQVMGIYEPSERPELFSSLVHMHINRLFSSDQRTHEALIYYLSAKQQLSAAKHAENAS